jgi:hypothetical protein
VKTCVHLEALERELESLGIALSVITAPYNVAGIWYEVGCTFDGPALRARLAIPESVTFEEYDGRVAGSDATWGCMACGRFIMGYHPRYAAPSTPRVA